MRSCWYDPIVACMGFTCPADLHHQIDSLVAERLDVVERSPDVLGGSRVFRGTRVPRRGLSDYLAAGDSLETFLDDFPSVSHEQASALVELAQTGQTAIIPQSPPA